MKLMSSMDMGVSLSRSVSACSPTHISPKILIRCMQIAHLQVSCDEVGMLERVEHGLQCVLLDKRQQELDL